MPKIKKPLPEERMRDKFYVIMNSRAGELGLFKDYEVAARIGISPQLYSIRKSKRTLAAWDGDDLARAFKKLRFTQDDIYNIFKEGMSV